MSIAGDYWESQYTEAAAELARERSLRVQLSEDSQRHLDRALAAEARAERLKSFIQRLGYGDTDWPEKVGCEKPGPTCPGRCIARCEDIDNLHITIHDLKAREGRLRGLLGALVQDLTRRGLDAGGENLQDLIAQADALLADPAVPPSGEPR